MDDTNEMNIQMVWLPCTKGYYPTGKFGILVSESNKIITVDPEVWSDAEGLVMRKDLLKLSYTDTKNGLRYKTWMDERPMWFAWASTRPVYQPLVDEYDCIAMNMMTVAIPKVRKQPSLNTDNTAREDILEAEIDIALNVLNTSSVCQCPKRRWQSNSG